MRQHFCTFIYYALGCRKVAAQADCRSAKLHLKQSLDHLLASGLCREGGGGGEAGLMASLIFISLAFVVACSSIAACCPLSAAAAAYLLANQTKMPVELLAKDTLTLFMVNRQAMWPRGAALLSGAWHTHTLR